MLTEKKITLTNRTNTRFYRQTKQNWYSACVPPSTDHRWEKMLYELSKYVSCEAERRVQMVNITSIIPQSQTMFITFQDQYCNLHSTQIGSTNIKSMWHEKALNNSIKTDGNLDYLATRNQSFDRQIQDRKFWEWIWITCLSK